MQFRVFKIESGVGYTFIIGSDSPPTNRLREQIGGILAGAWEELLAGEEKFNPSYGFELIFDKTSPTGENEIPLLEPNRHYLIFALLESEGGSAVGEPETVGGILRALGSTFGESEVRPKIGLIALYNCTIQVLQSKSYKRSSLPPLIPAPNPFREDRFEGFTDRGGRWPKWEG